MNAFTFLAAMSDYFYWWQAVLLLGIFGVMSLVLVGIILLVVKLAKPKR